nr:pyruvate:ferredoxin (flavodoxin) oxidoreductase [candidate division Zixibacteria bacterium]
MDKKKKMVTIDGNSAAAYVAHALSEVIAIYPITPSSGMGEIADEKSARGETNIWGTIPDVVEMQSEGGASGAIHGACTTGALTTTFTASQGLLLMLPNMFKIAGEMTPTVFHVSARSVATHALSIFGDHSDVMAARSTGFGLMASGSIQEVMDLAAITHAASIESRIPFVHFFDGFRTSHEEQKVEHVPFDVFREMMDDKSIEALRARSLSPDHPTLKGSSQNPDVFFQARETVNKYYIKAPGIVQKCMDRYGSLTGRQYKLFDYIGDPKADRVVVMMGSGAETMHELIDYLTAQGEKVGLIKVRLYRPFSAEAFLMAIPKTASKIAVLDRTKEPGSTGEPLYIDIQTVISEAMKSGKKPFDNYPVIVGGRYGLSSKEFNPPMAKAVLDNLKLNTPKNHFTVGIVDDVTNTSLDVDYTFNIEGKDVFRGLFYGLGADGTVGANKNSIKIIGENTDNFAQGYFVYDSKKAGAITVSHLRFGKKPIRSPYLISSAKFVACHNFSFLEKYDMLSPIVEGGTFLLNSPFGPDEVWDNMPIEVQQQIIDKKLKFFVIDGIALAKKLGLGARINMIMQTAFFVISDILPKDDAIAAIKDAILKTYGKKGEKVVKMNYAAVDTALENIHQVKYPSQATSKLKKPPIVPRYAPEFVQYVTANIISGKGDSLPVSAMPDDGTFLLGTTQYEKRNIAVEIPVWDENACIQCGICSIVCPHASIRMKAYDPETLKDAPETFKSTDGIGKQFKDKKFTLQIAPEDCTGCELCVHACPAFGKDKDGKKTDRKAIYMMPQIPLREQEAKNWDFFLSIPETDPSLYNIDTTKGSQFVKPLFEFSGACAGCGETPYIKLVSQLFGDRALIGNATGCSSIYGGNLPTTPYTTRADGRGPAWSNSLFEDNAEFALGMRLTVDKMNTFALELTRKLFPEDFKAIAEADQSTQAGIEEQRIRVAALKGKLKGKKEPEAKKLLDIADYMVKKSVWAFGGDGWAYDIGYGGLDHVMASGRDVNILVLDTEVYSNTGGQMSKASPMGAVAKFAAAGRPLPKKDLGMMLMAYGNVYIAQIAMGASHNQAVKAISEAGRYNGPSIIIAYSHCIAHGFDMSRGLDEQKKAVDSGHWILYRYNPALAKEGKNPLQLDSKAPSISYADYAYGETRFRTLKTSMPERAAMLLNQAQADAYRRYNYYRQLSSIDYRHIYEKAAE